MVLNYARYGVDNAGCMTQKYLINSKPSSIWIRMRPISVRWEINRSIILSKTGCITKVKREVGINVSSTIPIHSPIKFTLFHLMIVNSYTTPHILAHIPMLSLNIHLNTSPFTQFRTRCTNISQTSIQIQFTTFLTIPESNIL
jgi:hypothetical protein